MNLPNKLTVLRLILTFVIIILLVFPFYTIGVQFPTYNMEGVSTAIELKYIIAGIVFIIASITDFFDGHIARKYNLITNTGKMLDAIADKALVNSVLIILAVHGFVNVIVPVIIVLRDIIVNAIKMEAASKGVVVAAIGSGKIKTATLMIGLVLTFFYNIPFVFLGWRVSDVLLYIACIMSIVSAIQYYRANKEIILNKEII